MSSRTQRTYIYSTGTGTTIARSASSAHKELTERVRQRMHRPIALTSASRCIASTVVPRSHCRDATRTGDIARAFIDEEREREREREKEGALEGRRDSRFVSLVLFSSGRGYCCPPAAIFAHYPQLSLLTKRLRQCGRIKRIAQRDTFCSWFEVIELTNAQLRAPSEALILICLLRSRVTFVPPPVGSWTVGEYTRNARGNGKAIKEA